jgi:hypothetical protein
VFGLECAGTAFQRHVLNIQIMVVVGLQSVRDG